MGGRGTIGGKGGNKIKSKLPNLVGSEKQIKWANEIRNNVIEIINAESKVFEKNKSFFKDDYFGDKEAYEDYKKYSKEAINETKASKWISSFKNVQDNKDYYIKSLKKSEGTTDLDYRNSIRDKMNTASYAYKKFVNG